MSPPVELFDPIWLETASEGKWLRPPKQPVQRIWHDTRSLQPGDLYVAIRGARLDGHTLVRDAFTAGAVAALVDEAYVEGSSDLAERPLLVVSSTVDALGCLAAMHRHRIGAWITGITGSMGKTTVKEMTASILQRAGKTISTRGNWNNEIGLPLSLLALEPGTAHGVFEIGMNHPGEIAPLSSMLSPDWGIVTSIGPVHLEHFASVDAIAEEKADLLRALPRTGLALLPRDDPYYDRLSAAAPCAIRTVSLEGDADLVVRERAGRLLLQERGGETQEGIPWRFAGRHNVLNAGLAILAGRAAGITWEGIQEGLAAYKAPPMRWEEHVINDVTVINDAYNANPASMRAALDTFRQVSVKGRKWLVLGDMLELGRHAEQAHTDLGKLAGCGDWDGIAVTGEHNQRVVAAAREKGFAEGDLLAASGPEAVWSWLHERIGPGDAVLLKGSRGMRLERVLQQFLDRGAR